jgi:hypothetical protein
MRSNKDGLIAFRVTAEQKQAFETLVEEDGQHVSEVLRRVVERAVKKERSRRDNPSRRSRC